jgi:hypothetical protein
VGATTSAVGLAQAAKRTPPMPVAETNKNSRRLIFFEIISNPPIVVHRVE